MSVMRRITIKTDSLSRPPRHYSASGKDFQETFHNHILFSSPGRFLLTVFANRESTSARQAQQLIWNRHIDGYKRIGLQFILLTDHTLVYAHYKRDDSKRMNSDSGLSDECDN